MTIVFVPLDKRPYNYAFLKSFSSLNDEIHVVLPNEEDLGFRKQAASITKLQEFLLSQEKADAFVISIEMLLYGGLIPSRVHHIGGDELEERLSILTTLKQKFPHAKIYISNLIMRNPSYSSAEEEPEYYGQYGAEIFRWGQLKDKITQNVASLEEKQEWEKIDHTMPPSFLNDYLERRQINLSITKLIIQLADRKIIDLLFIPRDDTAAFSLGSMDRRQCENWIKGKEYIYSHPGTDEAMCMLMARAGSDFYQRSLKIYPITSHHLSFIPKYEDIPLSESLVSQIRLSGNTLTDNEKDADIILGLHTPYDEMDEARNQQQCTQHRDALLPFMAKLSSLTKPFVIADVAYANGGDSELLMLMDEYQLLEKCLVYAGWNTTGNTLGTVLSQLFFIPTITRPEICTINIVERLLSDWIYQGIVRWDVERDVLPTLGAHYSNFNGKDNEILDIIKIKVIDQWKNRVSNSFKDVSLNMLHISAPFQRMSGLNFQILHKN
ncbi:MAG: DUF4127 family protein [Brevinema sp.]